MAGPEADLHLPVLPDPDPSGNHSADNGADTGWFVPFLFPPGAVLWFFR